MKRFRNLRTGMAIGGELRIELLNCKEKEGKQEEDINGREQSSLRTWREEDES